MSNDLNRRPPLGQGPAVVSLVAAFVCALASDALASPTPVGPCVGERGLSTRVATLVERVRLVDPTLLRDLRQDTKLAQWRNK
jgi:hypothetical protein